MTTAKGRHEYQVERGSNRPAWVIPLFCVMAAAVALAPTGLHSHNTVVGEQPPATNGMIPGPTTQITATSTVTLTPNPTQRVVVQNKDVKTTTTHIVQVTPNATKSVVSPTPDGNLSGVGTSTPTLTPSPTPSANPGTQNGSRPSLLPVTVVSPSAASTGPLVGLVDNTVTTVGRIVQGIANVTVPLSP